MAGSRNVPRIPRDLRPEGRLVRYADEVRVLHTSDLHGKYKRLLGVTEPFDLWVAAGER